jgi:hypothetical protein
MLSQTARFPIPLPPAMAFSPHSQSGQPNGPEMLGPKLLFVKKNNLTSLPINLITFGLFLDGRILELPMRRLGNAASRS